MKDLILREEGQGLVEYALIIGLIAVVAIAALSTMGGNISSKLGVVSAQLS
ncbi:Flp family type IVb pilin [Candidatus Riflebacteria bacterium]